MLGGHAVHLLLGAGLPEDHRQEGPRGSAWAYPYKDAILAAGLIQDVNRDPGHQPDAAGHPRARGVQPVPDHEPGTTDPAKAKALLEEAGDEGYEIKFLFAHRRPDVGQGQGRPSSKALEEAGFKATPVADHDGELLDRPRRTRTPTSTSASAGWCSDWPSGATWIPPVLQSTDIDEDGPRHQLRGLQRAGGRPEDRRRSSSCRSRTSRRRGTARQADHDEVPPAVPASTTAVSPRPTGRRSTGTTIDNTLGMPTLKNIWVSQQ